MAPTGVTGKKPVISGEVRNALARAREFGRRGQWVGMSAELHACFRVDLTDPERGLLHAYRAQVKYMLGDLRGAEGNAITALALLPEEDGWLPAIHLAEDVLHEARWRLRHPYPPPRQLFWHYLKNWLRGRHPIRKMV